MGCIRTGSILVGHIDYTMSSGVEWSGGETGNVPNPDVDLLAPTSCLVVYPQTLDLWIRESTRLSYS